MGYKARRARARDCLAVAPGVELRSWRMSDAQALFRCVDDNRKHLREWTNWLDQTQSVEQIMPFLRSCVEGYKTGSCYRLGIWVEGAIGGVVSLEEIRMTHRKANIGYWLAHKHQGHGLMTLAVRRLIAYAFEDRGLETLGLQAATKNRRSRAVALRVGMTHEGTLRQQEWLYDHYVDHAVYTLLRSEWSPD